MRLILAKMIITYMKLMFDQGPVMKRFRPAAMGRAMPIRKRTSHLIITLSDQNKE